MNQQCLYHYCSIVLSNSQSFPSKMSNPQSFPSKMFNSQSSLILCFLLISIAINSASRIEKYIKLTSGVSKAAYLPLEGKRYIKNGYIIENPSTTKPNILISYKPSDDKISCSIGKWNAMHKENHGTEAILFTHSQLKLAVFGFRGTEPTSIKDWLKNFEMILAQVNIGSSTFKIHQGFRDRYFNIQEWFENKYKALPQDYTIIITGHSLGGAMTTIAATYASGKLNRRPDAVITFASPLVGGKEFRDYYRNVVGCDRTLRITAEADIIVQNPSTLLGYTHVCSALKVNGLKNWFSKFDLIFNHDIYGAYDRGLAKKYKNVNDFNFGCDRDT